MTYKEQTSKAKSDFLKCQQELDSLIEKMLNEMYDFGYDTAPLHESIDNDIELWKKYRKKTTKQHCDNHSAFNNYWLIYWYKMEEITREKIMAISAMYNSSVKPIHKYNSIQKFI